MQPIQQLSPQLYWVGASDRRMPSFENMHPLPKGITYNSYLYLDEKVALLNAVDASVFPQFERNLAEALGGRSIDYLLLLHMEPDHCSDIEQLCQTYPDMKLVGNNKTLQFYNQFFSSTIEEDRFLLVTDKEELSLGKHTLRFVFAPMVHWPEVMLAYETSEQVLFSADAFGSFGAFSGKIFADEVHFEEEFLSETRRYYCNIVGRYGGQVQNALKKLGELELSMIAPLHGPIWRKDIPSLVEKYDLWSRYEAEEKGVVIAYGTMYGNTEQAAHMLANLLAEKKYSGTIQMYDVSKTHSSYIIASIFRYSQLVLAAPTYNMHLYLPMHNLLYDMQVLNIQGRNTAVIANGSWAPAAHTIMTESLATLKDMDPVAPPLLLRSSLKEEQYPELEAMADALCAALS